MATIDIPVCEYYGTSSVYYHIMPREIFDALESAFVNGAEYATVDKSAFDKMIADYKSEING